MKLSSVPVSILLIAALAGPVSAVQQRAVQGRLDGQWKLVDHDNRDVEIPGTFESQIGIDFDGAAVYERELPPVEIPEHSRLILRFDGVATVAKVSLNGHELGSHTGAWTPFWVDATEAVRAEAKKKEPLRLRVEVDEAVGHHTQGFLPIIEPHFGGIWQSVSYSIVPEFWIDDSRLMVIGDLEAARLRVSIPIVGSSKVHVGTLSVKLGVGPNAVTLRKIDLSESWSDDAALSTEPKQTGSSFWIAPPVGVDSERTIDFDVPLDQWPEHDRPQAWSPDSPQRTLLSFDLETPTGKDRVWHQVAFRSFKVDGKRFLLNGKPLSIRGVLNWGYAPPGTAPSIDETFMRREIELARSHGFNLMKFCLWVPPQRYLDLCDELGMLAWIEYPTWHAQLTHDNLPSLSREYDEFFAHDRNHPSVILRSLTCETGSSAELPVIQSLYDQCKQLIPGAIVEDDSSWIEWNRVNDFYDDHPYGNNHTWVATLDRLKQFIDEHSPKPLILGEAIAADTWTSPSGFTAELRQTPPPFWLPKHLADNRRWLIQFGISDDSKLAELSRDYAFLMRKYQIEAYRREVPSGGYVVSVMRDFPLAQHGVAGLPRKLKMATAIGRRRRSVSKFVGLSRTDNGTVGHRE